MQGYHRIYTEGGSGGCAMGFAPFLKSHASINFERTRTTHFLLAGCVLASAGFATLSWPLLPPWPGEGGAQLARPGQHFPLLSLAQSTAIDLAFRNSGPQGIDTPKTEGLRSWGAKGIIHPVRGEGVTPSWQADPTEALTNSKSVSGTTASRAALRPTPTNRLPAPPEQAESGTRLDGHLEPVAAKPPGRTDVREDPEAGLADGSLSSQATPDEAKPVFLPTSLVELSDQERPAPLTISSATPTLRIAAADVMPPAEAHLADVPAESQLTAPDVSETTHMTHSMPEPDLVDARPGTRVAEGETQAPLVEFTDPDETGRFAMIAMEMAAPIAEPEGIMAVTAPPTERLAQSTAVRPIGPDIAHVPPGPTADTARLPAQRAIQRSVDIEQVAESVERSPHKAQPDGMTLAAQIDAMQIPPFALAEQELAALQSEAPVEMTVRVGGEAVGKVAFRMAGTRMIEVQLAGLLDLVADRLAPAEFVRLRGSAAANSFVPMQQLRAIGLTLRYDPVYDELLISA